MFRILLCSLPLFIVFPAFADRCDRAGVMLDEANKIRGLEEREPVLCRVLDKEEYFDEISEILRRDLKPDRLRSEERVFKMLGLIPEHFPFEECLIESFAHEAAAFYSPVKKSFVMPAWIPASDLVLLHEATHALQDQYYDLDRMDRSPTVVGDRAMAIGAMVEGDAMAVEAGYKALHSENPPEDIDPLYQIHPEPRCALPESLEDIFYFEYEFGERFVQSIKKRISSDELFRDPPVTTREIIHPERYRDRPRSEVQLAAPPAIFGSERWKLVFSEQLGEFTLRTTLKPFVGEEIAARAAAAWDGDRLAYFEARKGEHRALTWKIRLSAYAEAGEFLKVVNGWLSKRFSFPRAEAAGTYLAGAPGGWLVYLAVSRSEVLVAISPPKLT